MSNKVCIPVEIIRNSKLLPRARIIWAELSLLPRSESGEFVIHQKELSNLLGICVSTLRRAIKSLEENQLIQFVGLFQKKYKIYIFKGVVDASIDSLWCKPQEKEELDAGLRWHDNADVEKIPEPEAKQSSQTPAEPELLKLKYQFSGPLTSEDKENLEYAQGLARPLHKLWMDIFPLLNGKDGRPLLNSDLVELIVLSHPSDLSGSKLIKVIKSELQRYSDGQF